MILKNSAIIFILLIALTFFTFTFYFNVGHKWEVTGWAEVAANGMLYYLLFIFLRTFLIVGLSFFEYLFFRKNKDSFYHPLVTILVPSFNEQNVIENAILSLKKINYPNLEILVIDDGSFDMTTEIAQKFESKDQLRVIYTKNAGKANALNRGISEALGEFILCMDADSILNEDVLSKTMPYFENNPDLSAIAGRVEIGNSHNILLKFQQLEYITGLNLFKRAQSFLSTVTIVPGPIGIFKKSALQEIGMYDSDTFAEDADLTIRLLTAGHRIKYCSEALAVTEGPDTVQQLLTQRYRWSRGMVQAIMKNIGWLNPFKTNIRNFLIILYMLIETIFIPVINFSFTLMTVQFALSYGSQEMLGAYFVGLTLLDISLTLFSMITEREIRKLFLLAIINRLTFGLALEVVRFFSIFDELFGIPMKWGQLKRKGLGVVE